MAIWAIGDLHLPFGVPEKNMECFGTVWKGYTQRIEKNWTDNIRDSDLVLIPGDISWAIKFEEALIDLKWIDALPGTKVILKGNHDYWWPSNRQLSKNLPSSIHFVNNNAFTWNNVTIGGTRLWDTEEYSFSPEMQAQEKPLYRLAQQKIFEREIRRLRMSLQQLDDHANLRIAMTHYPPIDSNLQESQTSKVLEEHRIDICVFGHLHNIERGCCPFGKRNGILYLCTSADHLEFSPVQISPSALR